MATISEDFVSFETAKLLNEKGFDERLLTFYITDKDKEEGIFQLMAFTDDLIDNNHSEYCYLAPTLQMVIKWLREVHNIHVSIIYNDRYAYPYEFHVIKQHYASKSDAHRYTTYEECSEAAIKYCLENLI